MHIWAKLVTSHKIKRDIIYRNALPLTYDNYELMLREVAQLLDISTPLAMDIHYNHLYKYNIHKYRAADFVESIDFDHLELENI